MSDSPTATVQTVDTPDGAFTLISNAHGEVLASGWSDEQQVVWQRIHPFLRPGRLMEGTSDAADAVAAYYAGEVEAINAVAVVQHGTALQQHGWKALRGIRPGSPLNYSEFAAELGSPRAVRAAASICARNAVALFVPCHRVLRSNGTLGGFAWGLRIKRALLDRELAAASRLE